MLVIDDQQTAAANEANTQQLIDLIEQQLSEWS